MYKLITCIAAEDKAKHTVIELAEQFAIQATISHFARGFGRSAVSATGKLGQQTEKVILNAVVKTKNVDEIFMFMFHAADLNRPHGGLIYTTAINQAMISPNIDESHLEQDHA